MSKPQVKNEEKESRPPIIIGCIVVPLFILLMWLMVSGKLTGRETYTLQDVTYVQYIPEDQVRNYGFGMFKLKDGQMVKLYLPDDEAASMIPNQSYDIIYIDKDASYPFNHKITQVKVRGAVKM